MSEWKILTLQSKSLAKSMNTNNIMRRKLSCHLSFSKSIQQIYLFRWPLTCPLLSKQGQHKSTRAYTKMQQVTLKYHYTPHNEVWIHPVCPSVCPSVCLSVNLSCPPCSIYSSGWIFSIFATNDQYHERVCRMWWPLTLTYIFKVIGPWHRKSCPLCSVYSSVWILFICGTNDHYH